MRSQVVDRVHDPLLLEQKSLKEMYPVSRYLIHPKEEWKQQQLDDLGYTPGYLNYDPEKQAVFSADNDLAKLQMRMEGGFNDGSFLLNKKHPEDSTRDLLTDMEKTLVRYDAKKKIELEGIEAWDMREISKIRRHYHEQYGTTPQTSWMRKLKQGKWTDRIFDEEVEVDEEAVDETDNAKFNTDYDKNLDPHAKRVNAEFLYDYNQRKEIVDDADYSNAFKERAEQEKLPYRELANLTAKKAHYEKAGRSYGGKWFAQHEAGVETPREPTKASGSGRSLQSFVDEDEDDVYEMYQRQINQRPEEDDGNTEAKFKLNEEVHAPGLPRF